MLLRQLFFCIVFELVILLVLYIQNLCTDIKVSCQYMVVAFADSLFANKTVTSIAMATLFYVSWASKSFMGFFEFQTPAWIGADHFFNDTWQQVLPRQHFFVSLTLKYFMGSLHSIPLHRLEPNSFSEFQTPAWIGADHFFNDTWQQVLPRQHFFVSLTLK